MAKRAYLEQRCGVILHEMGPMVDEFDTCLDMELDQGSLKKIVEPG